MVKLQRRAWHEQSTETLVASSGGKEGGAASVKGTGSPQKKCPSLQLNGRYTGVHCTVILYTVCISYK